LAALVISGFHSTQFTMAGFLPREKSERVRVASSYRNRTETLLFLEAPYRLNQLLSDISAGIGPDRNAALAMDLTLPKERVMRDTLLGLKEHFLSHPFKGEFVLVVEGAKVSQSRGAATRGAATRRSRL
jgi:16S rRNA (cytidine1402-2'-O)-methyltransferase